MKYVAVSGGADSTALASMSPATARVVQYMGWRDICMSEEPTGILRGQFLKMYDQVTRREQEEQLLPPAMRDQIRQMAETKNLKLLEGGKR